MNTSALLEWDIQEDISGVASSSGHVGRVGEPMTSLGDLTDQTTYLLDPTSLADEDGKRWRFQLNVTDGVGNQVTSSKDVVFDITAPTADLCGLTDELVDGEGGYLPVRLLETPVCITNTDSANGTEKAPIERTWVEITQRETNDTTTRDAEDDTVDLVRSTPGAYHTATYTRDEGG